MPDLVVYYEGGNQLDLANIVKKVSVAKPEPAGKVARFLRDAGNYSALARRAEGLTSGAEWPKPAYETKWPEGLDEMDPDITRKDLPVNLSNIIGNLDQIRTDLAAVGSDLSVASFHWLAKEGLVVDAAKQKAILHTLNIRYFPYTYRDLERMTKFENRVFAKYDAKYGLPFIDDREVHALRPQPVQRRHPQHAARHQAPGLDRDAAAGADHRAAAGERCVAAYGAADARAASGLHRSAAADQVLLPGVVSA